MKKKTLLIAGSRGFANFAELTNEVNAYIKNVTNVKIITGCASGTDYMAKMYAVHHGIELRIYKASWGTYGNSAGIIRNRKMAEKADAAIIFWDGKSRGTKNMIEQLKTHGVTTVKIVSV